ncbi:MAG TPA: substrate-binding domain-containing protein [Fimbriimonadaceae bacterium]|nr:substrate-binding domain-containing protein [Fimbriimonadaceae bacterium]
MRARWFGLGLIVAAMGLGGCASKSADDSGGSAGTTQKDKALVLFSQANSQDPWRQVFDATIQAAAAKESVIEFAMQDAQGDGMKQVGQIETFLVRRPKVLLVSPTDESVKPAIDKAMSEGVPVILLDRGVSGDNWTAYVGGDNKEIGRAAGQFMGEKLGGKGTVLMIRGIANADPTRDRGDGFMESIRKFPDIQVIEGDDCGYERAKAQTYMERFLQTGQGFDAVYAHNDEMAIGALRAMQAAGTPKKVIVGIDACQLEVINLIQQGDLTATFTYPQPGPKGIELAMELLAGKKPAEKRILLPTERITQENADQFLKDNPNLAK